MVVASRIARMTLWCMDLRIELSLCRVVARERSEELNLLLRNVRVGDGNRDICAFIFSERLDLV